MQQYFNEEEKDFVKLLSRFRKSDIDHFFELLDSIINQTGITEDDQRCSYAYNKSAVQISFIIGTRYCLTFSPKSNWSFISSKKLEGNTVKKITAFSGGGEPFLISTDYYSCVTENLSSIVSSCQLELNRTSKSASSRHTIAIFKRAIFDKDYRIDISSQVNFQTDNNFQAQINEEVHTRIYPLNQILYGPPGTGKTYTTKTLLYAIEREIAIEESLKVDRIDVNKYYNAVESEGRLVFTTFHQSMSYEDFIEGIKPTMKEGKLGYKIQDGILKQLAEKAKSNLNVPYFLIIDEINRGNVSAIFGELITLIEEDKRMDADEQIIITLPYSKEEFCLPSNLYIIGTMNTADRSVEAMDTALRRRFSFIEMPPQAQLLRDNVDGVNLKLLLATINDRLIALKDSDHTIGHAFFINCKDIQSIKLVFTDKIIPLLQEIFYGELHKAELIIGNSFFKKEQSVQMISNSSKAIKFKPSFISRTEILQLDLVVFIAIYESTTVLNLP